MRHGKRLLAAILAVVMLLSCIPIALAEDNCPSKGFSDVDTGKWYHAGVDYMVENGYMKGTGTNTFSPNTKITRGMVVTILYSMADKPESAFKGTFSDVKKTDYYAKGVEWAAANGIVSGYKDGTFKPNNAVIRQDLACIIYRYATFLKLDTTAADDLSTFTDKASVSSYAAEAMKWCVAAGVISGTGNNQLSPRKNATRAEFACIMLRFDSDLRVPAAKTIAVASTTRTGTNIPVYVTLPGGYVSTKTYPMVILCHGHGGNHNEWGGFDAITTGLAKKGIVAVTLDYPGCGASTESFTLNTLTNMKADTLDVIQYMLKNYHIDQNNVGIFGYSMGGRITLELLAEKSFSFAAVEFVAPAEDTTDLKALFGGSDAWDTMKATANANGYCDFTTIYGQKQQLSKEWFADLEKYSDGLAEAAAANYSGNSLVIYATNDTAVSPSVSAGVAKAFNSAVVNTYAEGHSYSFYGKDPYTVRITNNSSINFFDQELNVKASGITGYVKTIEKYGNLDLTIPTSALTDAGYAYGDLVNVTVNGVNYEMPYCTSYSDVDTGSTLLRANGDLLIVAINMGDFATTNGLATKTTLADKSFQWYYGDTVTTPVTVSISLKEKEGYLADYLLHKLTRTNVRTDYANLSDAEFANFRVVGTTGMGLNMLYRSSSPVNPELGRNTYADAAAKAAGIKTVMNLADDEATMKAYEGYSSTYYSTLKVDCLNMGVDFSAAEFKTKLAAGLRYFVENEGPYLVHCNEGKDRAGFVSALLECYMGATASEVICDYMVTYYNYYGVQPGTEQYTAIANSNIVKTLQNAFGISDLYAADVNLKKEATEYITALGLTEAEQATLAAHLGATNPATTVTGVYVLEGTANKDLLKYGHIDVGISTAKLLETFEYGDIVTVTVNGHKFDMPVCSDYTDVATGKTLLRASSGKSYVILAINYGQLGVVAGLAVADGTVNTYKFADGLTFPMEVTIALKEKAGYLAQWQSHHLVRTDVRTDYPSLTDAEFANFRMVTTSGIKSGVLYRSSSPINPEIGRNTYADAAAQAAGVKVFVNLADSQAVAEAYTGFSTSYYSTQSIVYLDMPVDFTSAAFKTGLSNGYRYIINNVGPYLIHCSEGKDRAGMATAVLECLMGATWNEVSSDYMVTYYNYYGVLPTDAKYNIILQDNLVANLKIMFGVEDLAAADLKSEATAYLKEIGLSDVEITALSARLAG